MGLLGFNQPLSFWPKRTIMNRNYPAKSPYAPRRFPWLTGKKTRAERVIAFLQYLPITKGILRGKKMRLLPHQRDFVERVYAEDVSVRLAISTVARGNGKTGLDRRTCLLPHVRPGGGA